MAESPPTPAAPESAPDTDMIEMMVIDMAAALSKMLAEMRKQTALLERLVADRERAPRPGSGT